MKRLILMITVVLIIAFNFQDFWEWAMSLQRHLHIAITGYLDEVKSGSRLKLFMAVAAAYGYGVFHALVPGHGKTLLASYLITDSSGYKRGMMMSLLTSAVHAGSSVITFIITKNIVQTMLGRRNSVNIVEKAVYFAVIVTGLIMLFKALKNIYFKEYEKDAVTVRDNKSYWIMAVGAGIVPCPGILMFLFYTYANDMLPVGIMLVMSMLFGIITVLCLTCFLSIYFRNFLLDKASKYSKASVVLKTTGSLMIILFGVVLLAGSIA